MPPAETAFHEADINDKREVYFMCDDIAATLKGSEIEERAGFRCERTTLGTTRHVYASRRGKVGIYEPKHASPLKLER